MNTRELWIQAIAVVLFATGAGTAIAQETILYNFGVANTPPSNIPTNPNSSMVFDSDGNLYGSASGGFMANTNLLEGGVIYELSPSAGGNWTMNPIYSFNEDGVAANGLIFDANKVNLYGTTQSGGANGWGDVFELSPNGDSTWTETELYSFSTLNSDGYTPDAGVIFDAAGNLYGTTQSGGANHVGIVFELIPQTGGTWTEKILYNFKSSGGDGTQPESALVFDAAGNLYGTTYSGGNPMGYGTAYELTPAKDGSWTEQVLHTFGIEDTGDAAEPIGGLVVDKSGNLYGVAASGGDHNSGAVYELSPAAGGWTESLAYSFNGTDGNTDGTSPDGVVFDSKGNLVGTTSGGGANNQGTIYELTPANGSWTETVLYNFADKSMNDGFGPVGNLILDASGNFYGVTTRGGTQSYGTAFKFTPSVPKAATPIFSPASGVFSPGQEVKITDATPGATIYYTTDGDQPSSSSSSYEGPIAVSETETIKAIASAVGYSDSDVATATYTIAKPAATPDISPGTGTYTTSVKIKISTTMPEATIYFTSDGRAPTTASTKYTGEITVSASETIKAIADAAGYAPSNVASAVYNIQTAKPVFSPAQGKYSAAQTVKITDENPNAVIYYTTNNKAPTTSSARYTGKIKVSTSDILKAIAIAKGDSESAVATAGYVIIKPAAKPVIKPDGGSVAKGTMVTITDGTKGATIYYTTNGKAPTAKSNKYTQAITVSKAGTVEAMAVASGYGQSPVASAKFTIK